jgi:hypothetical protein
MSTAAFFALSAPYGHARNIPSYAQYARAVVLWLWLCISAVHS